MKIVCAAICKNESHNVQDFVNNLVEHGITDLCITDTGSTDGTIELLQTTTAIRVHLHQTVIEPFDFSAAKNTVISLVPSDADMVLHLDLDERIVCLPQNIDTDHVYAGERKEVLHNMISPGMVRLTPAQGWHWVYPIHEELRYRGQWVDCGSNFVIAHHQLPDKDRYEDLTEHWFEHDPQRLYTHRLTDLIHHRKYEEYVTLFREYGVWHLQGIAKWRALKNYLLCLYNLDEPPELEIIEHLKTYSSSSTSYYLALAYTLLDDQRNAEYWLEHAQTADFKSEDQRLYYNQTVAQTSRKIFDRRFGK